MATHLDWGFLLVAVWGFLLAAINGKAARGTVYFYDRLRLPRLPETWLRLAFKFGGLLLGLCGLALFVAPLFSS